MTLAWRWQQVHRAVAKRLGRRVEVRKGAGFDPLSSWIRGGGLRESSEFDQRVEREVAELSASLKGQVRETYHRMAMESMDAADACSLLSSSAAGRRLLMHVVETREPKRTVEFGSAFGVGSLALCHAIDRNGGGRFDGIEYEPWKAELGTERVQEILGPSAIVHPGRIEDVFPRLMSEDPTPVDLAFVDAVHSYEATMGYHELLVGHLSEGAIVIYDDVYWSSEMTRFWEDLLRDSAVRDAICVDAQWGVVRF